MFVVKKRTSSARVRQDLKLYILLALIDILLCLPVFYWDEPTTTIPIPNRQSKHLNIDLGTPTTVLDLTTK